MKLFIITCIASLMMLISGCSVTTLRCGISDDASYVELISVPTDLSSSSRYFAELCGFAYEEESNGSET